MMTVRDQLDALFLGSPEIAASTKARRAQVMKATELRFDIRAWVTESRAAQGLPPVVTDPAMLMKVAVLLDAHPAKGSSYAPRPVRSARLA